MAHAKLTSFLFSQDAVQALSLSEDAAFSVSYDQLIKVWGIEWQRGGGGEGGGGGRRQRRPSSSSSSAVRGVQLVQTLEQCSSPRVCGLDCYGGLLVFGIRQIFSVSKLEINFFIKKTKVSGEASALRLWRTSSSTSAAATDNFDGGGERRNSGARKWSVDLKV